MSTPRYIMSTALVSDAPKYEFPLQAKNRRVPAATLVVESEQGFTLALLNALSWAGTSHFSASQHMPIYPRVHYGKKRVLVTKVNGQHAWVEDASRGKWVPVGSLSL